MEEGGGGLKLTDLADMEANLFSSFSQGQAQKRRGRRAAQPKQSSSPNPLAPLNQDGSNSTKQEPVKKSLGGVMAQISGSGESNSAQSVSAARHPAATLNIDGESSGEQHKTSGAHFCYATAAVCFACYCHSHTCTFAIHVVI